MKITTIRKKLTAAFLSACLLMAALPAGFSASAVDPFTVNSGILTDYQGAGGDIYIPDGVKTVYAEAFKGLNRRLYAESFYESFSLHFPDSVEMLVGDFDGFSQLRDVRFNDNIEINTEGLFNGCHNLEAVTLPSTVTEIGDNCFYIAGNLVDVNIPASVTKIGESAFENCFSLSVIRLPKGLEEIGHRAFYGCESLARCYMPKTVKKLGSSAFEGCKSLTDAVIPDGITKIERSVFRGCESLFSSTLRIPDTVTSIGDYAFAGLARVKKVVIPASVKELGQTTENNAFKAPSYFGEEDYEVQLTYFDDTLPGLREFDVHPDNPNFTDIDGVLYTKNEKNLIQYPASRTNPDDYYQVPNGTQKINAGAFCKADIFGVKLPTTVEEIGKSAFSNSHIDRVFIPASVKKIVYSDDYNKYYTFGEDYGYEFDTIDRYEVPTIVTPKNSAAYKYATKVNKSAGKNIIRLVTDLKKPGKVKNIKVKERGENSLTLMWDDNSAAEYLVYHENADGKYEFVGRTANNSIWVYSLKSAKVQKFRIRAVSFSKSGKRYIGSKASFTTCTRPYEMYIYNFSGGKNRVKMKWSQVYRASGYKLYYKKGNTTKSVTIKGKTNTSYTLKGLKKGTYTVWGKAFRDYKGNRYYSTKSYEGLKVKVDSKGNVKVTDFVILD